VDTRGYFSAGRAAAKEPGKHLAPAAAAAVYRLLQGLLGNVNPLPLGGDRTALRLLAEVDRAQSDDSVRILRQAVRAF
jgi:hypothetical protein